MNIGIDIDDTLTNLQPVLFSHAQKYDYENFEGKALKDPYGYNTWDMFSWDDAEQAKFWENCYYEILASMSLRPFAKVVVNELKEEGNKIYIVTARSERDVKDTYNFTKGWLDATGLKYDELCINQQDKSIIAVEKQFDVFIDDKPENCDMVANKGIKTYIMDAAHNREYKNENVERIYSWIEFYYKIKQK